MNIALIIAGGKGMRMHQEIPKQFLTVNEKPVIVYTMEAFQKHADVDAIAVVCIGGLVYATLMTLFVVPCIYDLLNRKELRNVRDEDLKLLEL